MNKSFIATLTVMVAFSQTALAATTPDQNSELCLRLTSSNAAVSDPTDHIFSYTGLQSGHIVIYGESCYVVPGATPKTECLPSVGAGFLKGNSFEFSLQGTEYNPDLGLDAFIGNATNFNLDITTLTGTYKTLATLHGAGGEVQDLTDTGTVTAVQCHHIPDGELAADKKFARAIKKLDRMGTTP